MDTPDIIEIVTGICHVCRRPCTWAALDTGRVVQAHHDESVSCEPYKKVRRSPARAHASQTL